MDEQVIAIWELHEIAIKFREWQIEMSDWVSNLKWRSEIKKKQHCEKMYAKVWIIQFICVASLANGAVEQHWGEFVTFFNGKFDCWGEKSNF